MKSNIALHPAVAEQDARLGHIVDASVDEIYAFNAHTLRYLLVNQGARDNLGYSMDELREFTPMDIEPDFTWQEFRDMLAPLRSGVEKQVVYDTVHRRKDGTEYAVQVRLQLMSGETPPMFLAVVLDVTEQNKAAEALRHSEEMINGIAENLPGFVFRRILHADGRVSYPYHSSRFFDLFGISSEEVAADSSLLVNRFHPDDVKKWQDEMFRSAQSLDTFQIEVRVSKKDGSTAWVRSVAKPRRNKNGDVVWDGVVLDITEQKCSAAALQRSEDIIGGVAENLPGIIYRRVLHADGRVSYPYISRKLPEIAGVEAEDAMVNPALIRNSFVSEDAGIWEREMQRSAQALDTFDVEARVREQDGRIKWIRSIAQPRRGENGDVIWDGIVLNITEQKCSAAALHRSEEKFSSIADNLPGVVFRRVAHSNGGTSYPYLSNKFEGVFGISIDEAQSNPERVVSCVHSDDLDNWKKTLERSARDMSRYEIEMRIVRPDGGVRWLRSSAQPSSGESGDVIWDGIFLDITEQKCSAAALRHSEELIAGMANNLPGVLFRRALHPDGSISFPYVSEKLSELMGLDAKEAMANPDAMIALIHPEDVDIWRSAIAESVRDLSRCTFEIRLNRTDGECIWLRASGDPRLAENGDVIWDGIILDITAQKQMERELRREQRFNEAVLDTANALVVVLDKDGRIVRFNRACELTTGYRAEEMVSGFVWDKLLTAEEIEPVKEVFKHLKTDAVDSEFENYWLTKDGERRLISWNNSAIGDENGALQFVTSIGIDITERRRAEEKDARFGRFIEASVNEIFAFDAETLKFVNVNREARENLGYSMDELREMTPVDFKPEFDDQGFRKMLTPLFDGSEKQLLFETIHRRKDGTDYDVQVRLQLLSNENPPLFLAVILDVTEQNRAARALRQSEERISSVAANLPGIVFRRVLHKDGSVSYPYTSSKLAELFGVSTLEMAADPEAMVKAIHPDDRPSWRKAMEKSARELSTYDNEIRVVLPEGRIVWARSIAQPHRTDDGDIVWDGVTLDVTDRRQAEEDLKELNTELEQRVAKRTKELETAQEELVRKERLATLGQLTGMVSHELRNPLGTIRTALAVIEHRTRGTGIDIEGAVTRMNRNIIRCDKIIEEMLTFTRVQKLDREPTIVDEWLNELLDELAVPAGVTVRRELAAPESKFKLDRDRLRRAVINLYDNAWQAMNANGDRMMTVRSKQNKSRLEISVADTGPGMSPDVLANAFEPLYSTKSFGVGLGLPMVKQIMEQHEGGVEIHTEEGKGTEIVLWIPLGEAKGDTE